MHFVVSFAILGNDNIYSKTVTDFSPLLNENNINDAQHLECVEEMLFVYKKFLSHLVCLIGDSCVMIRKISTVSEKPTTSRFSEKLSFTVWYWLDHQDGLSDAILTVQKIFVQLRIIQNFVTLIDVSCFGALLPSATRCGGRFDMVERYFRSNK